MTKRKPFSSFFSSNEEQNNQDVPEVIEEQKSYIEQVAEVLEQSGQVEDVVEPIQEAIEPIQESNVVEFVSQVVAIEHTQPIEKETVMTEPNIDDLEQQIKQLQDKRQAIINEKRSGALQEARELVRTYGFKAHELGIFSEQSEYQVGVKTRKPAAVKFRHPENPNDLTWTGKGRKPKWYESFVAEHGSDAALLV